MGNNKEQSNCVQSMLNGAQLGSLAFVVLLLVGVLPDTTQALPRPSTLLSSSSASSYDHYHHQPASSSVYRTRTWAYRSRPASTGYSYTYNNGPQAHRQPMLAPNMHYPVQPAPIGFQNMRFGPFASFGFGANHPNAVMPPLRFGPLPPSVHGAPPDQSFPVRPSPSSASSAAAASSSSSSSSSSLSSSASAPEPSPASSSGSISPSRPASSSSASATSPSSPRSAPSVSSGPQNRRLSYGPSAGTANRARPTSAPAIVAQPSTSPSTPATLSGALGPAVVNDADIGFDVPSSSNSDSSSLAGPTVSLPANNPAASEPARAPLSSNNNNNNSPNSSDGFFDTPVRSG